MHTGNFIVKNYTIPLTSCGLYAIIFYCHEVIIFIYDFLKDKFYMERYRSGHNGTDSKSVEPSLAPWVRIPHSPPTGRARSRICASGPFPISQLSFTKELHKSWRFPGNRETPALIFTEGNQV